MFALGLASTLAALGIVSTYVGRAYGSIGSGLPIGASAHGPNPQRARRLFVHSVRSGCSGCSATAGIT